MAKLPYLPLYTGDVLGDTALQLSASATRGGWLNLLCYLWDSPTRGEITGDPEYLARLVTLSVTEWEQFIKDATRYGDPDKDFCIYRDNGNGTVTIINRRMIRDEKKRQQGAARVQKHRQGKTGNEPSNGAGNGSVTPSETRHIQKSSNKNTDTSKNTAIDAVRGLILNTQSGKKLAGWRLLGFLIFWDKFDLKENRAETADKWLRIKWPDFKNARDIPTEADWRYLIWIILAAKMEARNRWAIVDAGKTPKYPQGWITGLRWENYEVQEDEAREGTLEAQMQRFEISIEAAIKAARLKAA